MTDAAPERFEDRDGQPKDLRKKVVRSLGWNVIGAMVYQLLRVIRALVLARLLISEDYGLTGLARSALAIISAMVGVGFGATLVQLRTNDIRRFADTSFCAMLLISFVVFLFAVPTIPWLANFYDDARLIPIFYCVLASILIQVITSIPIALLQRRLAYRDINVMKSFSLLIVTVLSIGIALTGYGYWSLVLPEMVAGILAFVGFCWNAHWLPRLRFSLAALRKMLSFTVVLSLYRVLEFCYKAGSDLVLGKVLGVSSFGYVSFARNQSSFPLSVAVSQFYGVAYSALSQLQEHRERLISRYLEMSSLVIFVFGPILAASCALADPLVPFLFGEQWTPAVFPFQMFIIVALAQLLDTFSLILAQSLGRPHFVLYVNVVKTPLLLGGLYVTGACWKMPVNDMLIYLAGIQVVAAVALSVILWIWLRMSVARIWQGYGKGLVLSFACGVLLWWLRTILAVSCGLPDVAVLLLALAIGGIAYLAASRLFNREAFAAFLDLVRTLLRWKRGLSAA